MDFNLHVRTYMQAIRAREQEMVGQKGEVVQERGEGESSEGKTLLEVVNGIASRGTHRIKKGNRNRRPGAQFSPIDVLVARARGAMEENAAVFVDMGLCACGKIMQLTESNIFVCTRCKKTNKESSFFSADVDRSSLPRVGSHKSFTAAQRSMNHFLKRVDGFQVSNKPSFECSKRKKSNENSINRIVCLHRGKSTNTLMRMCICGCASTFMTRTTVLKGWTTMVVVGVGVFWSRKGVKST